MYNTTHFPKPSICEHVSRLAEYLASQKLTMIPTVKDRRIAGVYCRQCAYTSQVTLPLVDDIEETLVET